MTRIGINLSAAAALLIVAGCMNGDDSPATDPSASISNASNESAPSSPGSRTDGDDLQETVARLELERVRAEAESLLGMNEADLEPTPQLRIARRGEERFPLTMDLLPGRMNVELDDHGGSYVVTKVVVETSDGEIVVD